MDGGCGDPQADLADAGRFVVGQSNSVIDDVLRWHLRTAAPEEKLRRPAASEVWVGHYPQRNRRGLDSEHRIQHHVEPDSTPDHRRQVICRQRQPTERSRGSDTT